MLEVVVVIVGAVPVTVIILVLPYNNSSSTGIIIDPGVYLTALFSCRHLHHGIPLYAYGTHRVVNFCMSWRDIPAGFRYDIPETQELCIASKKIYVGVELYCTIAKLTVWRNWLN